MKCAFHISKCFPTQTMFISIESKLKLINNGYEGVIIAINPSIAENHVLLKRLE
ncbi:hypothetical protein BgiBS90_030349, partial [Biomphalaria glabrata]